jgi:hypothetical protein
MTQGIDWSAPALATGAKFPDVVGVGVVVVGVGEVGVGELIDVAPDLI